MLTYELELVFVFHRPDVIHLAQLVELAQCKTSLAQVTQLQLAVVLRQILISFRLLVIDF